MHSQQSVEQLNRELSMDHLNELTHSIPIQIKTKIIGLE